jgi:hypothetical protein
MAAQIVSGGVTLNGAFTETIPVGSTTGTQFQIPANGIIQQTLANGTGASAAVDTLYSAQLTLAAAATHINLHSTTDPAGNSIVFARVRWWFVQNLTTTAGYLVNIYTRSGTDPVTWLPTATTNALWVAAGGAYMGLDALSTSTNGWVVSSTAYDFTLDPGSNTVSVQVIIAGNSSA